MEDLKNKTKEELIDRVNELLDQLNDGKYGLYFDRKANPEDIVLKCQKNIPVLSHVPSNDVLNGGLENILIEGDNYAMLSALSEIYPQGFVDMIYIDPPYNTGANDWLYNNNYVDSEDGYRHTKWLNFMEKRLELAKKLLKDTGTIICAIDHYEIFNLGLLMDRVFGEGNKYGIITVVSKPEGRQFTKGLNPTNEFYLIYGKDRKQGKLYPVPLTDEKKKEFNLSDEKGAYRLEPYMRLKDGDKNNREYKPNNYYAIYVDKNLTKFDLTPFEDAIAIYPIYKGIEKSWSRSKELFLEDVANNEVIAKREGSTITIYKKYRSQESIKTHWIKKEYNATVYGTKVLTDVIGPNSFNFPKSVEAVKDALKITTDRDAVVMDFFAGSGTTAQAVLELNKEDGGNRRFILCTNNESNIMTDICYPRIKTVVTGVRLDGSKYSDGLPATIRYFKVDFAEDSSLREQAKYNLVDHCDGLLCILENCYDKCDTGISYNIYLNSEKSKTMSIYNDNYDEKSFSEMLGKISKLNVSENVVYYYSLLAEVDSAIEQKVTEKIPNAVVKPIPYKIYEIYKKIADDSKRIYQNENT